MGKLLLSLKSTAVFHTGKLPRGTREFKGYGALAKCEGDGAVLGFFDGPKGKKYLMVVNRSPFEPAEVTLIFTGAAKEIVEVDRSKSGKVIPVKLTSGNLSLKFSEGDGRLLTWKQ